MAFCTQCGSRLEEGDKFCSNCGAPVQRKEEKAEQVTKKPEKINRVTENLEKGSVEVKGAEARNETAVEKAAENSVPSAKPSKKKVFMGIGIAAGVTAFLALVVLCGVSLIRNTGNSDAKKEEINYVTYTNDTVCFSVEYPEGYMVTELGTDNQVLITEGEEADFQVSIEYAYYTAGDSAIYSAADFVEQVENDPTVLTDWIGTTNVETEYVGRTKSDSMEREQYDFWLEVDGDPYEGSLYIYDGKGEFGCYSYMCIINQNAEDSELFKTQGEKMADSFRITDACQAEGYQIYSFKESGLQFMVRNSAVSEMKESDAAIAVYPVEGVYNESNIWIDETVYEEESDINDVLEGVCGYYFSYKEGTEYTSQPAVAECGRYLFTGIDLKYYDGTWFYLSQFVFLHNGVYWKATMISTEDYYDITATAMADILFSLKFTDDKNAAEKGKADVLEEEIPQDTALADAGPGDDGEMVSDVIAEIRARSGFVADGSFKPLAAVDDFNGDGTQELLAVYEIESGSGVDVMYDVWSLGNGKNVCLKSELLFWEVGGDSGIVGIAKSDGTAYLAVVVKEPDLDSVCSYYEYVPWDVNESILNEDAMVYMEFRGNTEQPNYNRYILGDTDVDEEEFNRRQNEFEWIYKLDILAGKGNDGVMTFDEVE